MVEGTHLKEKIRNLWIWYKKRGRYKIIENCKVT